MSAAYGFTAAAGTGGASGSSGGNITIPSGVAGQVALLLVTWSATNITLTTPTGWSLVAGPDLIGTGQTTALYQRTLTAGDAGSSLPLAFSGSVRWEAGVVGFTNADVGAITHTSTTPSATSQAIPASGSATATSIAVALLGVRYTTGAATGVTPPAGWTERLDASGSFTSQQINGVWIATRDATVASAGTTASATATTAAAFSNAYTVLFGDQVVAAALVGSGWSVGIGTSADYTYGGVVDPPPPPPPPAGVLRFGTTLFGQSYSRYKSTTLGGGAPRYNAAEGDVSYTLAGTLRKGGAVTRIYGGNSPGLWTDAKPAAVRNGQAIIYSFKCGTEGQAAFKANFRAFLDSKPTTSEFAWICFWHEPDDEIFTNTKSFPGTTATDLEGKMTWWLDRNRWCREVLDEIDYSGRHDFRFGCIFTSAPYAPGLGPSQPRQWNDFWTRMKANRGAPDTWDFMGADDYNPAWDGANILMPVGNWIKRFDECNIATGLPIVIGEAGTPRPYSNYTAGYTYAQLDRQRADWLRTLFTLVRDRGYFDALSWWREPALKGFENPFSTIMATPAGYDAELAAAGIAGPPGGFDAPVYVGTHAEFMVKSIDTANTLAVGPHVLTYYT